MSRRTRRNLLLVGAVIAVAGGLSAAIAESSARPRNPASDAAARATPYQVFFLGSSFEGLKLSGRIRRLEKPQPGEAFGADFFSYLYGTCKTSAKDPTCPIPLEVQSWAACKRNRSVYRLTPAGEPLPRKDTTIRGVPASHFEEGFRLEVYTGRTTVVIFGNSSAQITRAALEMRSVDGKIKPREPLPPPAPGALTGELAC